MVQAFLLLMYIHLTSHSQLTKVKNCGTAKSSICFHSEWYFPQIILPFGPEDCLFCRTNCFLCVCEREREKVVLPPAPCFPLPFCPSLFLRVICRR